MSDAPAAGAANRGRGRAVVRSTFFNLGAWVFPILLGFVATPIILRRLGVGEYGVFSLVLGFIAYSFNLNFGRGVTKYVAEYRAAGREAEVGGLVSAALALSLGIGLAAAVLIAALAPWIASDVLAVDAASRGPVSLALGLAGGVIVTTMGGQVFSGVLQGAHRFDLVARIAVAGSFVLAAGNVALAIAGFRTPGLLAWNLGVVVLTGLWSMWAARGAIAPSRLFGAVTGGAVRLVGNFGWAVVGCQLAGNVQMIFERIWITRRAGAAGLTYYVVPMMIGMYLHAFVYALNLAVFPVASESASDVSRLGWLYERAVRLSVAPVVFMSGTLMVAGEQLLRLWVGPEVAANGAPALWMHALSFGMLAVYIVPYQTAEGVGRPSLNLWVAIASVLVMLPLTAVLTDAYGIAGAAAARLAGFAGMFATTWAFERTFFGAARWRFWLGILARVAPAAVCGLLAEFGALRLIGDGWASLAAAVAVGGVVYAGGLLLCGYMTEGDRRLLASALPRSDAAAAGTGADA